MLITNRIKDAINLSYTIFYKLLTRKLRTVSAEALTPNQISLVWDIRHKSHDTHAVCTAIRAVRQEVDRRCGPGKKIAIFLDNCRAHVT